MGQDRIERILAKRRKATEKIVDAHLYNPSKKWGEAEQEPSSDDYSFTSGIEPTKVENPYPTFSEKVAASMTPATPKNIAESLPQYKTAMDAEQAHEQRFADDADYREQWFQDNIGMGEEEFKANATNVYGERLGDLISRAETMHENIVAENAKHSTGFVETAENLRKAMANRANIDKLKGVLSSFKNNNLWSGLYEGADLLDVLSLGLSEVAGNDALKKALEKQSKGEELNEEEQFAIDASNLYDEIEETYDLLGGRSGWNKVGQGLGKSAEFIAQMAGTSGMGFSTSLMKNLGLKAGKQAVKNAMGEGLAKGLGELVKQSGKVLGRGVYNFGLSYLESIPRAALTPQTYSRYIELRNERLKNGESLEGNWLQDAGRAGIEMTNEIASEIWGSTVINDSFSAIGKTLGLNKVADALGFGRRRRTMLGWRPNAGTREVMRNLGYAGNILSEATSEAAGDVATNIAMGVFFDDARWGEMATPEYWTTLLGVTALQGAAFQSANIALNIPEYRKLNNIQQRRDKALLGIQSEQLRSDIEKAFTYDTAEEMGASLSQIDWQGYDKLDVANAMDAIRLEVPLRIAISEREESERISRFAPMMEGIMAEAYQGVDAENPMPQPISIVGSVEGTPIRVVSGDYNNPDAMLNVVNDATGEKFPVIASKVKDISEISLQDKIAESYKLMFSTEENVQRLSKVMDTLGRLAYYGKSSSADAIDIVKRAGFTVFEEGEVVTLVNGQQVEVATPMMSDGHYLVRDNDGNTSVVGLLDVVQPNMGVAEAQVQMANQQQQEVADEATAVVQQTMENAMPSSMPEGVAFGEVWVTPQGVGRVLEYNPQTGKVYVDINLSTDQMNKEDAMEVVEVDVADLQRKPSEAEMTEARNRSVRRNALMIYDETSDAAGAIQEVEEVAQPVEQAAEVTEQAPQEVPSMENVPTTADGAVDYDAITDADMYAKLLTQDLGSKEEALGVVNTSIEAYEAEIADMQSKKEKSTTKAVAKKKQIEAMQQQLDVLKQVRDILTPQKTETEQIAETPQVEVVEETQQEPIGLVQDDFTATLPKGEAELIDSLARSLGLSVEFVDQVNKGNSNAQILGNKVLIAKKNRDKAIKFLVGHEFTHRMQDLSPEAYAEFKAAVKEYMGEELYNSLLQKEIAKYREHNIYRTQEQLEDEIIADFAGSLAFEADVLDTFIAAHADKKSMWQAILDVLRAIREWILKDTAYDTAEARALQNTIDKLETLFQIASEKVAEGATEEVQYSDAQYSLKETDPATLEALNNGEKIKVYRGMQVIDGKLYPPMSAKVDGKMREPIELGVWERAEERPDLADAKGYFKLDKGNKTSLKARYNPYIHTSLTPLNDQFSSAQDRPNLVTVEVEIPASELTSGYKADKAKDAVGKVEWKAGVVQSQLSGTRTVILSRWDRPLRIVPDSEVAQRIVEMFGDKKVVMPSNVVTPSLRAELEKLGVTFKETDNQGKEVKKTTLGERSDADSHNSSSEGLPLSRSERLSGNTLAPLKDDAKIGKDSQIIQRNIKKILNKGGFEEDVKTESQAVRFLGKAFNMQKSDSSHSYYGDYYEGDYLVDDKVVHLRISTHPATGDRMGNADADHKVSIVIRKNGEHNSRGEHDGYEEIIYEPTEISPRDAANAVVNGVKTLIETGEYVDVTGKAHRTTYPTITPNGEVLFSLKDLDPVAYDDAGNIIPLSERFNPEKEDIRYSLVERTDEKVTFENFFEGTSAIFTQISEKPTTKPDYTSRSGSRYWYGEDEKGKYVIRQSDHWSTEVRNNNDAESFTAKPDNYSNIASCYWAIDVQGYDAKYEPINITDVKYIDYNADNHKIRINLNSGQSATRVVHPRDMRQYYTTLKAEGVQAANEYVVDLVNDKYNDKPLPNVLTAKAYLDDFTKWKVERHSLKDEETAVTTSDGTMVAETNGATGQGRFSLKTYREGGREALANFLNTRVKGDALTPQEAEEMLRDLDDIYNICETMKDDYAPFGAWSEAKVVEDKDGNPVFSVIKQNGEYAMNLDFSLVCKKRRTLDAVLNRMIAKGMIESLPDDNTIIAKINAVIRKYGFETACALCFVDARRFQIVKVANNFCDMYNGLVDLLIPKKSDIKVNKFNYAGHPNTPFEENALDSMPDDAINLEALRKIGYKKVKNKEGKMVQDNSVLAKMARHLIEHPEDRRHLLPSDFLSTAGFDQIKTNKPEILKLYNAKKGTGGPKAAFSDVQYLNDIINKNWSPEDAFAVGGVRVQSFSDYVPRMVFDYIQMMAELAAKKLPAHAYTKEPLFAKTFGLTGMKINLSLVPDVVPNGVAAGLDADGNYVWKEGETFPYEEAIALQNADGYKANCGTIAVGVSDAHIWKMLDDANIRMVIPYHKSGLPKQVAKMNNVAAFTDYTKVQNTRKGNYALTKEEAAKVPNYNELVQKHNDPRKAAQAYLDWCKEMGYTPKFSKFAEHPNYYKLLEDFTTMVDDVYAPQGVVTFTFPNEEDAFGSLADLIKQGLEEDAVLEGERDAKVGDIVEEVGEVLGIRYSLIGEKGAANLDAAEEATIRLENLDLARELESIGKAPISIKMATGWERGADGKWRYEIPDVRIKDPAEWIEKKSLKLADILVNAEDIFTAYPDFRNIKIKKTRKSGGGVHDSSTNTIELGVGHIRGWLDGLKNPSAYYSTLEEIQKSYKVVVERLRGTILHEMQHAIQYREGFAQGGSSDSVRTTGERQEYEAMVDSFNSDIDAYNNLTPFERMSNDGRSLRRTLENKRHAIDVWMRQHRIGKEGYRRLAGEVEARNVERRSNLTMMERLESLVEDTEDVARKDQIFIYNALQSEKASSQDTNTDVIMSAAKEKFGTTNDMREAGWILPDGSMLDFSGKHEVRGADTSFLNGQRSVDHRAISEIAYDFDENETGVETDLGDFLDRGAIRIDYNAGSINLNVAPTKAQRDRLKRLIEHNDGDVYIDFGKGWDTEHYVEYASARPTRVLGDIDRYFDEGIKPTGNVQYSLKDKVDDTPMTPAEIRAHMFENITRHHEREVNRINRLYDAEKQQVLSGGYTRDAKISERLQFLMPKGKTSYLLKWQVVHDIANGLKVKWSDSNSDKKRGLSTELGLDPTKRKDYAAITTGAQMYVEDYVSQLVEENGYVRGTDKNKVRDIVLNALSQYTRPKEALDALEQQFLIFEDTKKFQESIDNIERARANALQEEDEKFEAQKASYDKNPRKFERDYLSRMEQDLRWLNLKEHEIRIMRDKIQRIRADHKSSKAARAQYLAEVKEDIKRFLSNMSGRKISTSETKDDIKRFPKNMSGRNISVSEARFIMNALEKATSVENVSYLLNRIATIEYYATNRVEQERKARLLKMKLSFFIPEENQSVEQYLEQEKISRADAAAFISRFEEGNVGDDMTVFRAAFKDKYKGVDSKGVTVAKLIDAETAEIMKFISSHAYDKVDLESIESAKEALYEEAERLKNRLPFSQNAMDKIDQAQEIIYDYWRATAERAELKKSKPQLDDVEARITEAWKDGDHNLLSQLRAEKDALIKERASRMPSINKHLVEANNAVERLLLNGKRLLSEEREAQRQHDIEVLNDVVNDITNFGADYQELMMKSRDHQKQAKEERKAKRLKVAREWTDSFNQLLTYLAPYAEGGKGLTYTRFMSNVHKAVGECNDNMDLVNHQINNAITRIFGKQFRYKNLSQIMHRAAGMDLADNVTLGFEKVGKETIPHKWHLNMANALYVLAAWNQADGRVKLEANGVTEEDIAYVESLIREKDTRFLDFMYWVIQELLPSRREGRYNEVFRKTTGRWMPYIENYFPIHILPSARHTEANVAEFTADNKSVSPGAIKERIYNTNMVDLNTDFFKALMENLTSMETWASLAEVERDMNTILSNNRAKDLMNARLGIDFADRLKTAMQITLGTLTSGKVGGTERWAMDVARMWGATKIGFRASTAFKQLSGAGAMLAYTSNPLYLGYVLKNLVPTDAAEMLPILKKRWEEGLLGNVGLMDLSKGDTHISGWLDRVSERKADMVSTITKIGMYPNKVVDYYVSAVMAKSVYQFELQRYKKLGYSEAEAKRRALMDAEDSYNKTQQSSEMAYLSSGQVNPNILYRGLNVFMNNSIANFRIGLSGFEDVARGLGRFQKAQRYYRMLAEKRLYDKYIAEGKSEEDALRQAEQEALKQHSGMKRMGYVAQGLLKVAWGWFGANLLFSYMGILLYEWWGDDDERKEEMRRMLWFSAFYAPLQLIPWSKVAWDFGAGLWNKWRGGSLASNALPMLEGVEEMITSGVDIVQTLQEGEDISMAQWYNTLNAVSILGVGVDMDTFVNITDGIIDMAHGDWMEGTLDLLSVPNSQVKLLVGDRRAGEDWNKYMTRILRTRSILDKNKMDASEAAKFNPQTQKWVGETSLTTSQKSDIKKMYNRYEEMYQQDVLKRLRPNMEWYEVEKRYAEIMDELGWTPNKAAPKGVANVELPVEVMNTLRYLQGNSSAMITQKHNFVGKDEEYAKKLDVIYQDRKQLIQLYDDNVK